MTDDQLQEWWPDLGVVVVELRSLNQASVADLLVNAVGAGATSGEILEGVAMVMRIHGKLRSQLGHSGAKAWDAVMADVHRAYPGSRFGHWLARTIWRFNHKR